jgi:hypothetical protein
LETYLVVTGDFSSQAPGDDQVPMLSNFFFFVAVTK